MSTSAAPDLTMRPDITAAELAAVDAEHYGWTFPELRTLQRALGHKRSLPSAPTDRQRQIMRAWLTATDARAGLGKVSPEAGAAGFYLIAVEVAALDDNALTDRFVTRMHSMRHTRYLVRPARAIARGYLTAELEAYRAAGRGDEAARLERGEGYVIWDRWNGRYVLGSVFRTWTGARKDTAARNAAEADRPLFPR
ncbi:hypothetical protein ACF09G_31555 [Streptomyces albogriseolus]|uniref:hypothetical protein n=1 Tax=Streptomyces albogriseolus TaxID=1887 RepID=UPI0019C8BD49|nr:hypothetical protein [Streptomyces sp.]